MTKKSEAGYHYTACGLNNVYLVNLPSTLDYAGEKTITVPNTNRLHAVIREQVGLKPSSLTGLEIRFLRTALGITQAQLARHLHKDSQTVGRWERGETSIDGASETLLRVMALEDLAAQNAKVRDLAERVSKTPSPFDYRIDASDPEHYRPAA